MTMSVLNTIKTTESLTYDPLWLRTIRDHRQLLLARSDTEAVEVPPSLQVATRGDPIGFLLSVGLPVNVIPAIIALNRLEDFTEFSDITRLYVPSTEALEDLKKKIKAKYVA